MGVVNTIKRNLGQFKPSALKRRFGLSRRRFGRSRRRR